MANLYDVYQKLIWSKHGPSPKRGSGTSAISARATLTKIWERSDYLTGDNSYSDLKYILEGGLCQSATYEALAWLEEHGWLYKYDNHACKYACTIPERTMPIMRAMMAAAKAQGELRTREYYTNAPVFFDFSNNDVPEDGHSGEQNDFPLNGMTFQQPEQTPLSPSQFPQEPQEEEVVDDPSMEGKINDGDVPPPATDSPSVKEHPPTPEEDDILDGGDGDREVFDAWALNKLQQLGASIGDHRGATLVRAMTLCKAIAAAGEGIDYRTRCEWLNSRVANYTSRQLEDEGPNPPTSVHQAVGWLERDLHDGSLKRYADATRYQRAEEEVTAPC